MADKTIGFKVTDELYDKAKLLIESSGLSSKEWFENALATYEVKTLQTNSPEFTRDLSELEVHTTRIYELVVNMVQQSIYFKDQAVREVTEQLAKKEQLLSELQEKLQSTKDFAKSLQEEKELLEQLQEEQTKQLEDARKSIENNQLLIEEYKEKNDTLSGLVNKYQGYAEENEQLKAHFAEEKEQLIQSSVKVKEELEQALNESKVEAQTYATKIAELEKTLQDQAKEHKQEISLLEQRHAINVESAVLKKEREYQEKLQTQIDSFNSRIQELQNENNQIRADFETRLERLLQENNSKRPENE